MITFNATIQRFDKKGEKTGWSYIEISAAQAKKLKPDTKTSFRVKGKLDSYPLKQTALLPLGNGKFILPINSTIRKGTGKKQGDKLKVTLEPDESKFVMNADFMACVKDDPAANSFFKTLPAGHQRYFSKWIDSAKTVQTKTRRIVMAVNALARKMGFPEMLREEKRNKLDNLY
ncbi:MAG: YdeI/OmpD-associated family protein [Cyclobacteriaceae bacterium]|nr:YdeI/OmpD-associated family protein [Cyclobacteriaceae bacterium]